MKNKENEGARMLNGMRMEQQIHVMGGLLRIVGSDWERGITPTVKQIQNIINTLEVIKGRL